MTEDRERARAILLQLRARPKGGRGDWAFVEANDQVWAAQAPAPRVGSARTAISNLVHGVHDILGDQTFFVLRQRIWCSGEATPYCRGAVKVAAKRLTSKLEVADNSNGFEQFSVRVVSPFESGTFDHRALWPEPFGPSTSKEYLRLVARIADQVERGSVLHRYDRAIATIIVAADGAVLAGAANSGSKNKSKHAEVMAVRSLTNGIPRGATVYCTLKPCRMCAGAIWQAAQDPLSIHIVYAHDDRGAMARGTVFDDGAYERDLALTQTAKNA